MVYTGVFFQVLEGSTEAPHDSRRFNSQVWKKEIHSSENTETNQSKSAKHKKTLGETRRQRAGRKYAETHQAGLLVLSIHWSSQSLKRNTATYRRLALASLRISACSKDHLRRLASTGDISTTSPLATRSRHACNSHTTFSDASAVSCRARISRSDSSSRCFRISRSEPQSRFTRMIHRYRQRLKGENNCDVRARG